MRTEECATEGCTGCGRNYFTSSGVGSYYCDDCAQRVEEVIQEGHDHERREWERLEMERHFAAHPHG